MVKYPFELLLDSDPAVFDIVHNEAAEKARGAGLKVVMSMCMLREHMRMGR